MILQIGVKIDDKWKYEVMDDSTVAVDDIVKQFKMQPAIRQITMKKLPAKEVDLFGGRETSGSVPE